MRTKTCPKCNETKSAEDYYINKKGYLSPYCKSCTKAVIKEYRKTEKGKQAHRDANRRYYETENGRKGIRARAKKWEQTEKGKAYFREKNRKQQLEKYYADPEYYKLKMRARYLGCHIGVLKQVLERDEICQLCGSEEDLQFDHIKPQKLGGKGTLENLQLLCADCNNFKGVNLFLPGNSGMIVIR